MKGGTPWLGTVAPTISTTTARAAPSSSGLQPADSQLEALHRALGQELQADHQRDRADDRDGVERRGPGADQGGHVVAEQAEVGRAEQNPADDDQVEGHEPAQPAGEDPAEPAVDRMLGRQPGPLEGPPGDEVPGGAVPEAAERHGQHQVDVGPHPALAVAAERDVEVVAQEARQRHVPAAPEVAEAGGAVGAVEVLREDEAHQAARGRSPCRCSREKSQKIWAA